MTREEAIRELKQFSGTTRLRLSANFWVALNMAIKALEQEPIFDKIRAEIEQMDFDFGDFYDNTDTIVKMVLQVIDKCKTESEGEND